MDRIGDQFFAGPALPLDQNVAFVVPETVNLARQGPHGARFTDELRNRRARAQFIFELSVAANKAAPFDRLANGGLDPVNIVEWFLEIIEGASPDAAHGTLDTAVAGHDDDLDFRAHALDLLEQLKSADRPEQEVDEYRVEARIGEIGLRLCHGFRERDLVADPLENPLQRPEQERLVVNEKHEASLFRRGIVLVNGSRTRGCHARPIGFEIEALEWFGRAL